MQNVRLLKWQNFFYGFRPYEGIAILYYVQVSGSYALGLAVFSIASIASALFEVPTGVLSDRVGRRKTVILGAVSALASVVMFAVAQSFEVLVIGAILMGLTWAFRSGNNDALLYESLKDDGKVDDFAHQLGRVNSMFELSLGVSALLATLAGVVSLRTIFVISIPSLLIHVVLSFWIHEPKKSGDDEHSTAYAHLGEAMRAFWRSTKLRKLSLAHSLDYAIEETYWQFKPAFIALLWPTWALGISRFIDNICGFLGYRYAGHVVSKFGAMKTLLTQQVIGRLNIFAAVGLSNFISPLLLNFNGLLWGFGQTASRSLMQKEFTDKQRATMDSLNSLLGSILYAITAVSVGLVADAFGPAKTIFLLAITSITVVLIHINLYTKHR